MYQLQSKFPIDCGARYIYTQCQGDQSSASHHVHYIRSFSDPNIPVYDKHRAHYILLNEACFEDPILNDSLYTVVASSLAPVETSTYPFSYQYQSPNACAGGVSATADALSLAVPNSSVAGVHNSQSDSLCTCYLRAPPTHLLSYFTSNTTATASPSSPYTDTATIDGGGGTSTACAAAVASTSSGGAAGASGAGGGAAAAAAAAASVRTHRHGIAGQMSYFKMLGFGFGGPVGFRKFTSSSGANSLFSTAVISGSSSAPNLRDMISSTASASALEGFGGVPPIRPLETLHNALSLRQLDNFLDHMTAAPLFRTPSSTPPKYPSTPLPTPTSYHTVPAYASAPVASTSGANPPLRLQSPSSSFGWSGPPSYVSSSGPSSPGCSDMYPNSKESSELSSSVVSTDGYII